MFKIIVLTVESCTISY